MSNLTRKFEKKERRRESFNETYSVVRKVHCLFLFYYLMSVFILLCKNVIVIVL